MELALLVVLFGLLLLHLTVIFSWLKVYEDLPKLDPATYDGPPEPAPLVSVIVPAMTLAFPAGPIGPISPSQPATKRATTNNISNLRMGNLLFGDNRKIFYFKRSIFLVAL